jgi:hypothetical protein
MELYGCVRRSAAMADGGRLERVTRIELALRRTEPGYLTGRGATWGFLSSETDSA